ncbi:hypothetical protein RRG08_048791 [Elysia crispata]|uniref:MADF domain-containing protein n=1 Tax=Elysia crispata TaxID=231223 RepID=A0AAE1E1M9_9GAST|nr:hypothetical protein RRG08_048791 [Elysia crispata]
MDDYKRGIIELVGYQPLLWHHKSQDYHNKEQRQQIWEFLEFLIVAPCIDAVCRAYPMEGAIKACATLRADLMCAACRVPSMEGQPKNPECRAIACGRRGLVCGMARVDKLYATCRVSSMEGLNDCLFFRQSGADRVRQARIKT